MRLVFFPFVSKGRTEANPYSGNYRKAISRYFDVIPNGIVNKPMRLALLKMSWIADYYLLNWIESIPKGLSGFPLFLASYLSLFIIIVRRKKIVWMFHNLHPHHGENIYTKCIQRFLFNNSSLIITHSKIGRLYAEKRSKCKVIYYCHPFSPIKVIASQQSVSPCDLFIWGTILRYKGIPEFLQIIKQAKLGLSIRIIGKCSDVDLINEITNQCSYNIVFENRYADVDEIAANCRSARFVVFPYLQESVSSSGALIETIAMGGTPVGPNFGAFNDMSEEGLCFTYNCIDELLSILSSNNKRIDSNSVRVFCEENNWESFAYNVSRLIYKLK